MERIEIRPRPRGDGWTLYDSLGVCGWYRDIMHAVDYARWRMGNTGGMLWICDRKGFPIVSEIVEPTGHSVMARAAGGPRKS